MGARPEIVRAQDKRALDFQTYLFDLGGIAEIDHSDGLAAFDEGRRL
jgi:hypothetical protein